MLCRRKWDQYVRKLCSSFPSTSKICIQKCYIWVIFSDSNIARCFYGVYVWAIMRHIGIDCIIESPYKLFMNENNYLMFDGKYKIDLITLNAYLNFLIIINLLFCYFQMSRELFRRLLPIWEPMLCWRTKMPKWRNM